MHYGIRVTVDRYTEKEKEGEVLEQNGSLVYVEHEDGSRDWYGQEQITEE